MKNVIFISPNFPTNYWQFCRELKMKYIGLWHFLHSNMEGLNGWSPTMSTGWSGMPNFGRILTFKADFGQKIFPGLNISPK